MAGYSYPYRSSSASNSARIDDCSKPSYASDHVCRPVIVDAEGRKSPIVFFRPTQNSDYYVSTRTETIVQENVISPYSLEHKHIPYRSPDSPEGYEVVEERWHLPPSPVKDRSPKVDEFFTKVQTEASRPRFSPMNASTRRQTAKPTGFQDNTVSYGSEFNDHSKKEWEKPSGNAYENNYDYFGKYNSNTEPWAKPSQTTWGATPNSILSKPTNGTNTDTRYFNGNGKPSGTAAPPFRHTGPAYTGSTEPPMITHGGWERPSASTWASAPDSNLSRPTSDINTAIGVLKEAAKPSVYTSPNSRYTEPCYTETIDNKEAAKRYGKFNLSSQPYATEDKYTTTIDSREAARKYHGTTM
ncbi:hypothetical protein JCGZ_23440 [Jatropha curcas]|uniref:Uncharacterized protein n=1 Tax=Jatropha curcas TaxID=180498 RepID=A0A067JI94_JATCU|nr:hypothetical protein JCGZ_23440 [Jatropha curcas]